MHITLRFPIKGLFYYAAELLWEPIQNGQHLILKAEPDNSYDANAIQVFVPYQEEPVLIGYIPRQLAKVLVQHYSASEIQQLPNRVSWKWRRGKLLEIELEMRFELSWHESLYSLLIALWLRKKHQWQRFKKPKKQR